MDDATHGPSFEDPHLATGGVIRGDGWGGWVDVGHTTDDYAASVTYGRVPDGDVPRFALDIDIDGARAQGTAVVPVMEDGRTAGFWMAPGVWPVQG